MIESEKRINWRRAWNILLILLMLCGLGYANFRDFKYHVTTNSAFIVDFPGIEAEADDTPELAAVFFLPEREALGEEGASGAYASAQAAASKRAVLLIAPQTPSASLRAKIAAALKGAEGGVPAPTVVKGDLYAYYNGSEDAAIEAALAEAKARNLYPLLLSGAGTAAEEGEGEAKAQTARELPPLEREAANLKAFAQAYGADLMAIAAKSIGKAARGAKPPRPERGDYANALFDKGASFAAIEKDGEIVGESGSVSAFYAIASDVAFNAYRAAGAAAAAGLSEGDFQEISLSLLTNAEEIAYADEADLYTKILAGVDGLIARDGGREGILLPSAWRRFPDKEAFVAELKVRAGMSPTYWGNPLKIFRFRTVDIRR